jgi:hypothetical protein
VSPHRQHQPTPPILLVVALIGAVMVTTSVAVCAFALVALWRSCGQVTVPGGLSSLALASLTGMAGLLAPGHQLLSWRGSAQQHTATMAGEAAAHAVLEHDGVQELRDIAADITGQEQGK